MSEQDEKSLCNMSCAKCCLESTQLHEERDRAFNALREIEQKTIDHVAVRIARAALATPLGRPGSTKEDKNG
jgi:hypothetical protein